MQASRHETINENFTCFYIIPYYLLERAGMIMILSVIGGGLAGAEAAWQAAESGVEVHLYEMRPSVKSGVHHTDFLGEPVCTDYFGPSDMPLNHGDISRSQPLLREELRVMKSLLMKCADKNRIDSKKYFAIDRRKFAEEVTEHISHHENIKIIREECKSIPSGPAVIATGPLTSRAIGKDIAAFAGNENYSGFESSAPLIHRDSIQYDKVICYENREHIFCPLTENEFNDFFTALSSGERVKPHMVEQIYITDVKIPDLPHLDRLGGQAVEDHGREDLYKLLTVPPDFPGHIKICSAVKLEQDKHNKDLYKLMGFQTRLKYGAQKRIFSMIPGLEQAEFVRFGHIHQSCYINSGQLLPTLQHKKRDNLLFAGEIAGTDTYLAAMGTGWLAGQNGARVIKGKLPLMLPPTTMYGALCNYLAYASPDKFQPMVPNLFLLEPCPCVKDLNDTDKIKEFYHRSLKDLREYLEEEF